MARLRWCVFWLHLAAGAAAGLVILVMSITGAVLALKPQILNAVQRNVRFVTPPAGASRLGVQAVVARAQAARPGAGPETVTLQADPFTAASVGFGRDGTIYIDSYSGRFLGEGSTRAQRFFRSVESWHRWLGVEGGSRARAGAVTGASNAALLLLAVTGPYLWWPRNWSWAGLRNAIWFRSARGGRARDFIWHNVIGLWCAPVLIVLTLTGVVMSYPRANALLFRFAGSTPPIAGGGQAALARAGEVAAPVPVNLDAGWARATERVPAWRSITARLPARAGAGLACVGGAVLVWTGLALAFRRFLAWRRGASRPTASAATKEERSPSSAGR